MSQIIMYPTLAAAQQAAPNIGNLDDVAMPMFNNILDRERGVDRIVICEDNQEISDVICMGLQYAVRLRDHFSREGNRLGLDVYKMSIPQAVALSQEFDTMLREKYQFAVPNVVIDLPWNWRLLLPKYQRRLFHYLALGTYAHRVFFVVEGSAPRALRRYPWEDLSVISEEFFFVSKAKMTSDKLKAKADAVGISRPMVCLRKPAPLHESFNGGLLEYTA